MQNNSKLTVVMYHYVREIKNSNFPNIKGLEVSLFKEQLDFLSAHYNFVTVEQVMASYDGLEKLPEKAVLLTFDDGYSDHFNFVFPELARRKIQGSFYLPAKTILENKILDVNKIHFILAKSNDVLALLKRSFQILDLYSTQYKIESYDVYLKKLAEPTRFDPAEVVFFKRLFQKELDVELRNKVLNQLFEEVLLESESEFSKKLYMNPNQLKTMLNENMHIGHHGFDHLWLDSLSQDQQRSEIAEGYNFLKNLGVNMNTWSICYPYGAFNDTTLKIVAEFNCKLGLCTQVRVADLAKDSRLTLPRLDTNDLPKQSGALPNSWFDHA